MRGSLKISRTVPLNNLFSKERHGSSRHAILKRIQSIYGITDERAHIRINKALRELAESGAIIAGNRTPYHPFLCSYPHKK